MIYVGFAKFSIIKKGDLSIFDSNNTQMYISLREILFSVKFLFLRGLPMWPTSTSSVKDRPLLNRSYVMTRGNC